jgi:hypothetical protein
MEGSIMTDIRMSQMAGIPFGDNDGRPASTTGQPYFNGESARLELYTSQGWQNIVQETPSIVSISGDYLQSSATNIITINGQNFSAGAIASARGTNGTEISALTTVLDSATRVYATFSNLSGAYEPYDIKVTNPSNMYGTLAASLYIDQTPVWNVSEGLLGTFTEGDSVSISVGGATDPESSTITYSSSNKPSWLSLNTSTGLLTGTAPLITSNTTYSFSVSASDGSNVFSKSFSILVNDRVPTWSTSSILPIFSRNVSYSTTVVATDDSGVAPTYSLISGSLPTGLSLNSTSGVISGTASSSTPASFTLRATDNGGNTADRAFTMANSVPTWSTTTLTNATINTAYSTQLVATDDSGANPTYSLYSGTLPSGLSLSSAGVISGTPTAFTTASFTVRATDANSGYADQSLSLTVSSGISATGGTVVTSGGYKYHTFTGSGTFAVSSSATNAFEVLLVAGGGGGGNDVGGGGGAGGAIYRSGHTIANGSYSVVIGGGSPRRISGDDGNGASNSTFNGMTAFRGGGGTSWANIVGLTGGCGGGGAGYPFDNTGKSSTQTSNGGGTGYGSSGGNGITEPFAGGGGGGAGGAGQNGSATPSPGKCGDGGVGIGLFSTWASATGTGSSGYYAGGGGGSSDNSVATRGAGGLGGGGRGLYNNEGNNSAGDGVVNTGGGGGGCDGYPGGAGGSGICIVRYPA